MTSKYYAKQRRPAAASILDQRKLLECRQRLGLTLAEVEEMSAIPKSTLHDYEHGRIVPQLHQFKKLCQIYQLDIFEIMELLNLKFVENRDLKTFRTACHYKGLTPAEALREFMLVYAHLQKMDFLFKNQPVLRQK
ncbi:MAG: helix-turn-helix domain-containing protein [Thermodesulfobacteriota bacterium]